MADKEKITEAQEIALESVSEKIAQNDNFMDKLIGKVQSILKPKTEVELEKFELENGVVLEIEGSDVFIITEEGERIPAPVGEAKLQDGRVVVIQEEGKVAEIKESESNEEVEAEVEVDLASKVEELAKRIEAMEAKLGGDKEEETEVEMSKETIEAKSEVSEEVSEKVSEENLSEAQPFTHSPEKEIAKVNLHRYSKNSGRGVKANVYTKLFK
jgi:hypothetical protein